MAAPATALTPVTAVASNPDNGPLYTAGGSGGVFVSYQTERSNEISSNPVGRVTASSDTEGTVAVVCSIADVATDFDRSGDLCAAVERPGRSASQQVSPQRRDSDSLAVFTQDGVQGHRLTVRDGTTYATTSPTSYVQGPCTNLDNDYYDNLSATAGSDVASVETAPFRSYLSVEQQAAVAERYAILATQLQQDLGAAAAQTDNANTREALLRAQARAATLVADVLNKPALSATDLVTRSSINSTDGDSLVARASLRAERQFLGGVVTTTGGSRMQELRIIDGVRQPLDRQITPEAFAFLGVPVSSFGAAKVTLEPGGADFRAIEADFQELKRPDNSGDGRLTVEASGTVQLMFHAKDGSFGFLRLAISAGVSASPYNPPPRNCSRIRIDTYLPPDSPAGGELIYRVECRENFRGEVGGPVVYRERVEARGVDGERTSVHTGLIEGRVRCTVDPVSNGNWGGETPPPQTTDSPGTLLFRGPGPLAATGTNVVGDVGTYDPRNLGTGPDSAAEEKARIADSFATPTPLKAEPEPSGVSSLYSSSATQDAGSSWSDSCPTPRQGREVLFIPRLQRCWVVGHEGINPAALNDGIQRYPGTVAAGRQGTAAIAGHRTTNSSPFYYLDRLHLGDRIKVKTVRGTFVYEARRMDVVRPNNDGALKARGMAHRLVLTTCSGGLARRLVVQAVLL